MRKSLFILAALVCLSLFYRIPKSDLGTLQPVQLVQVTTCSGMVHIRTDTGLFGEGADFAAALENLHQTSPGKPYLETADFLLITPASAVYLPELKEVCRPATEVAQISCVADGKSAAAFLQTHRPPCTLRRLERGDPIPKLIVLGEQRYELEVQYKI